MSRTLYARAFAAFGERSVIVAPLKLRGVANIRVGADCAIFEGVWLQAEEGGLLTIGDGVYVGHRAHLHAVEDVVIGDGTMLADGAFLNSGRHMVGDRMRVGGGGAISIGRGCFLGQNVIVLGGVTIGDGATIGAGAVVTKDVPPGATAVGVPARLLPKRDPSGDL